jgi:hypothetical protein
VSGDETFNCECVAGADGAIAWNPVKGEWDSTCIIMTCPPNAQKNDRNECQCNKGFTGSLVYGEPEWTGQCTFNNCPSNSVWVASQQECLCNAGYTGKIIWTAEGWEGGCGEFTPCPANSKWDAIQQTCVCSSGYDGAITWMSPAWQGGCAGVCSDWWTGRGRPSLAQAIGC